MFIRSRVGVLMKERGITGSAACRARRCGARHSAVAGAKRQHAGGLRDAGKDRAGAGRAPAGAARGNRDTEGAACGRASLVAPGGHKQTLHATPGQQACSR